MERRIERVARTVRRGPTEQVNDNRIIVVPGDFAAQSPFLLLSEDWFQAPLGFETHPHRGLQTVTFVLDGALEHRDHTGAHSVLRAGDVQWMTAGRGVMHSEMPHADEMAHTLQLWLNLPARMKMIPARYVDQHVADVPVRREDGAEVRVYAGRSGEVSQAHGSDWPMMLLDIRLAAGRTVTETIPASWRGFVYMVEGAGRVGADKARLAAQQVAWIEPTAGGDEAADDTLTFSADEPLRALLFAGPPIDEPVVAYGPFVMNSMAEIRQAYEDYRTNRFVA